MKIITWIRPASDGKTPTLRSDYKLEGGDTPVVQKYGLLLYATIQGLATPSLRNQPLPKAR